MKFRCKIFILCLLVYTASLSIIGIIVVRNTYSSMVNKEIERGLDEEQNIYDSASMYLYLNDRKSEGNIKVEDYSQKIVDMLSGRNNILCIFNSESELLAVSSTKFVSVDVEALSEVFNMKRNYVMKWIGNNHFLITNHLLIFDNKQYVLSYIKNITHIDYQKKELTLLFFKVGIVGFIFIIIVTGIISKFLLRPVEKLSISAEGIACGDYSSRVEIESSDEIGILAEQFNKMADEIENKIIELENESEKKQRFIDNLTHELRTPLTSIIGYAELLMNIKYDEEKFHKGLGYIYSEGKRMLKLSQTLMSMILIREDAFKLEKYSALKLLNETASVMKVKADAKNLEILVDSENIELFIDMDMMKGVLINLIDNAIKASDYNRKIILGVERSEENIYIYVKDNGKGMAKDEVKKVLEPFYRVDKSRARKEGGVGLGLALCNEIVKKHGAKLEINSTLGSGTTVKIIFRIIN